MIGIDLSIESVRLATETYPDHIFTQGDMHHIDFADNSFDFIYSSLTIHYSAEPLKVYQELARVLAHGGSVQFSIGHPMRWASEHTAIDGVSTKLMGYTEGDSPVRLYGDYNNFAQYSETFPSGETLQFWIGPPSMHFGLLRQAGFVVEEFIETRAIDETKEVDESYYKRFNTFPQFTVFVARKP